MGVAAIIPAYNEERTIGNVVRVCKSSDLLSEVIVVSDGSVDSTAVVACDAGATVVDLPQNVGKGGAMMRGVAKTECEYILFLDADLIGLTEKHIASLVEPVINEDIDMTIGVFEQGRIATDLAQIIAPNLSGQRALKKDILKEISNLDVTRFGIEVALTRYASAKGLKTRDVILPDMSHVMKEEKLGLVKGFAARMKMYWEIAKNTKKSQ
ncbi:glycosyltransferase involved in cell wall biosynthesis [Desulfitispora alkaliphila]|uniref:glycosyltransferase family 2 protein n=1 Tax=Desulfitispora alkaliphila TaxID=622674 RepID=UPI003D20B66F